MTGDRVSVLYFCRVSITLILVLLITCADCQTDNGPPLGVDITCSSPAGYDITNLTIGYWSFSSDKNCVGVNGTAKATCVTYLAFCKALGNIDNCNGSSICVQTFNGTGRNETVRRGAGLEETHPFTTKGTSIAGSFVATFPEDGGYLKPDGSSCNISTKIEFECSLYAEWIPAGNDQTKEIPASAQPIAQFDENTCQYHITVGYAGACLSIQPANKIESLSAGTVLIIIFFVSLTAYFILGGIINYCRGYRGREIIPQTEFWINLPVLIADGILFTCRGCQPETSTYDSI